MKKTSIHQLCALRCAERERAMQLVCKCASELVPSFHKAFVSKATWGTSMKSKVLQGVVEMVNGLFWRASYGRELLRFGVFTLLDIAELAAKLGGSMLHACKILYKHHIKELIDWYANELMISFKFLYHKRTG